MKRILTTEEKRSYREAYRDNAVMQMIKAAYKEKETEMQKLGFSPEEIWINCFIEFDRILRERDRISEMTENLWNDIHNDLRDDIKDDGREYEEKELDTATSCIVCAIIVCMEATDDYDIMRHSEKLIMQIANHRKPSEFANPLHWAIGDDLTSYIKDYVENEKYISDLVQPKGGTDPIKPKLTSRDRITTLNKIKARIYFMSGYISDGETKIMTTSDYKRMIEAIEYLLKEGSVKKLNPKIRTKMNVGHLRYTFYLVWKNEGKCIARELWLEFLHETFEEMADNQNSLGKHFSDKPGDYDNWLQVCNQKK